MINKEIVAKAIIEKVQNEHVNADIRTNLMEGYERPDEVFIKGNKRIGFTPDVLMKTDNSTEFYEIDLDQDYKVEKWKLFSLYLKKQGGTLNIVTPEENLNILRTFLNANKIDAKIHFFS